MEQFDAFDENTKKWDDENTFVVDDNVNQDDDNNESSIKLIESTFGAGQFFTQGIQQVECLKAVNPEDWIPLYTFPILYMNGALDHRDCENLWLNLCQNKTFSSLKVYEHGDHFFTHDSRYVEDILQRIDNFAQQIKKKKK